MKKVKENNIYDFSYNHGEYKGIGDSRHCFDGMLVARRSDDGGYMLIDTFWGIGASSGRSFTISEARKKGTLKFICNLDEVEYIKDYELRYYDEKDIIRLPIHHGYRTEYAIRKGAIRSSRAMLEFIKRKIAGAESKIASEKRDLDYYNKTLVDIKNGDIPAHIMGQ